MAKGVFDTGIQEGESERAQRYTFRDTERESKHRFQLCRYFSRRINLLLT